MLLVLFLPVLLVSTGCNKTDKTKSSINLELSSVRSDIYIYKKLELSKSELKIDVAKSILKHVLIIRTITPEVSSLKGKELETMCLLATEEITAALSEVEPKELKGVASTYLLSIKPYVMKKIKNIQVELKGEGCYLSPNQNI